MMLSMKGNIAIPFLDFETVINMLFIVNKKASR